MAGQIPSAKDLRAFKIGARARKFATEDCIIEGYELLYTALAEAKLADPPLHTLLMHELERYEQRVSKLQEATEG